MTKRTRAQVLADADAFQRRLALIESRARVARSVAFLEETAGLGYCTDLCEYDCGCDTIPRENLVVEASDGASYFGDEWLLHSTRVLWASFGNLPQPIMFGLSYWEIEDSYGQPAPREPAFKKETT